MAVVRTHLCHIAAVQRSCRFMAPASWCHKCHHAGVVTCVFTSHSPDASVLLQRLPVQLQLEPVSRELYRLRGALPTLATRTHFEEAVNSSQFIVVKGETGSGKSTQLPQYLADMASLQGQVRHVLTVHCLSVTFHSQSLVVDVKQPLFALTK